MQIYPKRVYPLNQFFYTKFGMEEGLPGSHPHAKFHRCGFNNMGLQLPKTQKLLIFGINFGPEGYILCSNVTKFGVGRESQVPTVTPTFSIVALKIWITAAKIAKNSNFWYKFAPKIKYRGS